jgi:hypothetical protein
LANWLERWKEKCGCSRYCLITSWQKSKKVTWCRMTLRPQKNTTCYRMSPKSEVAYFEWRMLCQQR